MKCIPWSDWGFQTLALATDIRFDNHVRGFYSSNQSWFTSCAKWIVGAGGSSVSHFALNLTSTVHCATPQLGIFQAPYTYKQPSSTKPWSIVFHAYNIIHNHAILRFSFINQVQIRTRGGLCTKKGRARTLSLLLRKSGLLPIKTHSSISCLTHKSCSNKKLLKSFQTGKIWNSKHEERFCSWADFI